MVINDDGSDSTDDEDEDEDPRDSVGLKQCRARCKSKRCPPITCCHPTHAFCKAIGLSSKSILTSRAAMCLLFLPCLTEVFQAQFHIHHQRIASDDLDKPPWLSVNIELLGVVGARAVEHPMPYHASADRKTRHESPIRSTSKHPARAARQLHQCFCRAILVRIPFVFPITRPFD
jgi:hypothetical protein